MYENFFGYIYISMIAPSAITKKFSNANLLRQAIVAEYDAITLYQQMADSTNDPNLKKVFLHVAQEEKEHVGEFEKMLEKFDKEHQKSVQDGKKEVLTYTSFKDWVQNLDPTP